MPVQQPSPAMSQLEGVLWSEAGQFGPHWQQVRGQVRGDKLKQFCGLADPAARAQFLLGLPEIFSIEVEPAKPIFSLQAALEYKEKGNDCFRARNFGEAFKNYSSALQRCPVNEENPADPANRDYSVILANRSAALDSAGLFDACIKDIDRALLFGYPRELWYKIYKRKGHACVKMKQYILAKEALEIALKNVGRSDIKKEKDRDNYRVKIRKQMTVFNVTKTLYNCEFVTRTPSCLASGETEGRGLSSKLSRVEDGGRAGLVAAEEIHPEDVLVALDPYVAVVNVTGGRAGGKICPHTIEKMFNPQPCKFGSEALFGSLAARDEASRSYHRHEWRLLPNLDNAGMLERARLALRMVTKLEPDKLARLATLLNSEAEEPESELAAATRTFRLSVSGVKDEARLAASLLGIFLLRNLSVSGYMDGEVVDQLSPAQLTLFSLLERAVLVSLQHTRRIEILDVPKFKSSGFIDQEVQRDAAAFGIYPDLLDVEASGTGSSCTGNNLFHC